MNKPAVMCAVMTLMTAAAGTAFAGPKVNRMAAAPKPAHGLKAPDIALPDGPRLRAPTPPVVDRRAWDDTELAGTTSGKRSKPSSGGTTSTGTTSGSLQGWMHTDVGDAWAAGYKGQGVRITVVDDFSSTSVFPGNFGTGKTSKRHGEWTLLEASMVAPSATMAQHDFYSGTAVKLSATGLNVLNLSYGMYAAPNLTNIGWSAQESSIIAAAQGKAVVSKAAGNDSIAIGDTNNNGQVDYLNTALKGASSAIYVGALTTNGSTSAPASMANYSNTAGADATVQNQFVVVGVDSGKTDLAGTSFAAPIVSGYAAILGSKFTAASANQITQQLLNTARQDTINGYNPAVHGRGEASLSRALAPVAIQ